MPIVGAAPQRAEAASYQCSQAGIACIAKTGYSGKPIWGYGVDSRGNNCTTYAAFRLKKNGAVDPGGFGDAGYWARAAAANGIRVNGKPVRGSIAQWDHGSAYTRTGKIDYGHVAYVERVDGSTIHLSDSNYYSGSRRWTVRKSDRYWPSNFIHLKDLGAKRR